MTSAQGRQKTKNKKYYENYRVKLQKKKTAKKLDREVRKRRAVEKRKVLAIGGVPKRKSAAAIARQERRNAKRERRRIFRLKREELRKSADAELVKNMPAE